MRRPEWAGLFAWKSRSKAIFWTKLPADRLERSVWGSQDLGRMQGAWLGGGLREALEATFPKVDARAAPSAAPARPMRKEPVTCFDTKRDRNCAMVVRAVCRQLKMEMEEVADGIDLMDPLFTPDILEQLDQPGVIPSEEDCTEAQLFREDMADDDVPTPYMAWTQACTGRPCLQERVKGWLLRRCYADEEAVTLRKLGLLHDAGMAVLDGRDNGLLVDFLGLCLAAGNALNAGHAKVGLTPGFVVLGGPPASWPKGRFGMGLAKFAELKVGRGQDRVTLLGFLARWAGRDARFARLHGDDDGSMLAVITRADSIRVRGVAMQLTALKVDIAEMEKDVARLRGGVDAVARVLAGGGAGAGSSFDAAMRPWHAAAAPRLAALSGKLAEAQGTMGRLVDYFGADPKSVTGLHCLQQLHDTLTAMHDAAVK